jgi:hypothetical protein
LLWIDLQQSEQKVGNSKYIIFYQYLLTTSRALEENACGELLYGPVIVHLSSCSPLKGQTRDNILNSVTPTDHASVASFGVAMLPVKSSGAVNAGVPPFPKLSQNYFDYFRQTKKKNF